ncbi:hypothetical protein CICLE_v10004070mg [Citrus x clementina]|uniref:Uncharacterized protein n=1 Tax=Citrus clementina TaxID=85681 RepID=V4TAH6_CITCL|nr:hypothetical protein CICLE_v10004070mg [Citrus x clementina]
MIDCISIAHVTNTFFSSFNNSIDLKPRCFCLFLGGLTLSTKFGILLWLNNENGCHLGGFSFLSFQGI